MESIKEEDFHEGDKDQVIDAIGIIGKWQIRYFTILCFVTLPTAFPALLITFVNADTDFWCIDNSYDRCDESCPGFEFNRTTYQNTLIQEMELVCSRSWLASTSQSIFFLGFLLGRI